MGGTCREWMRLARWLRKRGVTELAACTEDVWRDYAEVRWANDVSRRQAVKIMSRLTDLWAFDRISAHPSGISRPPWDTEGVDDFLPASRDGDGGAENLTEPLAPQVIGPLLVWAIRMVEDFADDILAAWAETCRLTECARSNPATPEGLAALKAYLLPLLETDTPIPFTVTRRKAGIARTFIAGTTGASRHQVMKLTQRYGLVSLALQRPGPCPLHAPVTGRIDGRPWREHMDYRETATLMRHLGTAAMIVCLYLTGMRPQEIQGLRSGCCPDPDPAPDGTPRRHLIRSHHYKNVTDDDGHHVSGGEEREVPWVAITPVVHAIRVLERMVPEGELLLSATHHDFPHSRGYRGALKYGALSRKIEDFVAWANHEALLQGLPNQVIPGDPHGPIGLSRFRRSLAWHIARRPGGLIALAIQYGHMRTVLDARTSSGYGTRSRRGIHSELDVETALAAADTAAHLRDRIAAGERISGPAARRAITATFHAPRFEGRMVPKTFAKKATAYLARDGHRPVRQPRRVPDLRLQARHGPLRSGPRGDGTQPVRLPARLRQRGPHRQPRAGGARAR
ncbi:integrase [Streptomyces sp. NPDC001795]|uniref:integrase n=1 Tax=unclassified Streptomyces TaxID=2593676 RepID=UPI00332339F4